jgi:importin-5
LAKFYKHLYIVFFFNRLVFGGCRDAMPRVRYAAVHCLGQLCTDFAYTLQSGHHAAFFSHVLPLIQDGSCARVQCHALASLINFSQDSESAFVGPYLDTLMPALFSCLGSSRADLQEQTVTSLACLANVAPPAAFVPYYTQLMPPMLAMIGSLGDRKVLF